MFSNKIGIGIFNLFCHSLKQNYRRNIRLIQPFSKDSTTVIPSSNEQTEVNIVPPKINSIIEPKIIEIEKKTLTNVNINVTPIRQIWIENMYTPISIKLGLFELHPKIFSVFPNPELIQKNHKWQTLYKHVNWLCLKTRAELKGSGKKPWPQKGSGRARHGSRRAPMWIRGGWATGPRGPRTYYYMLPFNIRLNGLIAMLSSKFAQNDLHVVDTFETFPADGNQSHLEELCETRGWGPSVLFVDKMDLEFYPKCTNAQHFYEATTNVNHINVIPVYGLNVFSMLKHETLVLTVDALNEIQECLLFNLERIDLRKLSTVNYKPNRIYRM